MFLRIRVSLKTYSFEGDRAWSNLGAESEKKNSAQSSSFQLASSYEMDLLILWSTGERIQLKSLKIFQVKSYSS